MLKFIPTHDGTYNVSEEDVQVYVVQRKSEYPHRWVAEDMNGEQVSYPDQYRHDLFDRLKDIHAKS